MENNGIRIKLRIPVRLANGRIYKGTATIIREQENLGRSMLLIKLDEDDSTSWIFHDEYEVLNGKEEETN